MTFAGSSMFDHVSVCGTSGEILVPALNQPRGRPYTETSERIRHRRPRPTQEFTNRLGFFNKKRSTEWGQRDGRRSPIVSLSVMRAGGFSALLRLPNRFVVQR